MEKSKNNSKETKRTIYRETRQFLNKSSWETNGPVQVFMTVMQ